MKTPNLDSNEDQLAELLRDARPNPELPLRFHEAVWRRIERSATSKSQVEARLWIDGLVSWVLRPRIAIAVAALVLAVGGTFGVMDGRVEAKQVALQRYVDSVAPSMTR